MLKLRHFVTGLVLLAPAVTAGGGECENARARKEWRHMAKSDRLDFITAVKCLMALPAQTSDVFTGARSRYDDFQALHIDQADYMHYDSQFLPWHRYYLHIFHKALEEECGYNGVMPYWDWTLDATEEKMSESPLFDKVYGFGGNGAYIANVSDFPADFQIGFDVPGRTGGGCVSDGPFANMTVNMGPANHTTYTPHCLRRDFSPSLFAASTNQFVVDWITDADDFWHFSWYIQGTHFDGTFITVHGGGHVGVGGQIGEMSNTYSSPGDPLFWLHHGGIDRHWWSWQQADWPARRTDVGGPDTQFAYPFDFFGDIAYENITLDTPLHYGEVADAITVRDVMDTQGGVLCYTYE